MGLGNLILVYGEDLCRSFILHKSHLAPTSNGQIVIKVLSMLPRCNRRNRWKCSLVNQQINIHEHQTGARHNPCPHRTYLQIAESALNDSFLFYPENGNHLATWRNYIAYLENAISF